MTKTEKAIQEFINQKNRIHDFIIEDGAWTAYTGDLVIKYIGADTNLYFQLSEWSKKQLNTNRQYYDLKKYTASLIIDYCIEYINNHGIRDNSKRHLGNFISRMSEGWAIFWATMLVSVFFYGGYFLGDYLAKNKIDQEKIDLKNQIEKLKLDNLLSTKRPTQKPAEPKTKNAH